jgi:hypothetical protein
VWLGGSAVEAPTSVHRGGAVLGLESPDLTSTGFLTLGTHALTFLLALLHFA